MDLIDAQLQAVVAEHDLVQRAGRGRFRGTSRHGSRGDIERGP